MQYDVWQGAINELYIGNVVTADNRGTWSQHVFLHHFHFFHTQQTHGTLGTPCITMLS